MSYQSQVSSSAARAREIVRLVNDIAPTPSLVRVYEALERQEVSGAQLTTLIHGSPQLAARVLRMANSAFYSPTNRVSALPTAIGLIGTEQLRVLVLATMIVLRDNPHRSMTSGYAIARITGDLVRSAVISRALAELKGANREVQDSAFATALLHDVGHLYLIEAIGEPYANFMLRTTNSEDNRIRELGLSGTTHEEVGGAFVAEYRLPEVFSQVIAHHHVPDPGSMAELVRVSDTLVLEMSMSLVLGDRVRTDADMALMRLGLSRDMWKSREDVVKRAFGELLGFFDSTASR